MTRPVVVLPLPDSPTSAEDLAPGEVEVDPVDRADDAVGDAGACRQPARIGKWTSSPSSPTDPLRVAALGAPVSGGRGGPVRRRADATSDSSGGSSASGSRRAVDADRIGRRRR